MLKVVKKFRKIFSARSRAIMASTAEVSVSSYSLWASLTGIA